MEIKEIINWKYQKIIKVKIWINNLNLKLKMQSTKGDIRANFEKLKIELRQVKFISPVE